MSASENSRHEKRKTSSTYRGNHGQRNKKNSTDRIFPRKKMRETLNVQGPQQRPLLSKHVRKTKPSFVWFVAEAFNEEELREIIDSAYDAPKGIFEMLGKTWEDSIYINHCFYFGPAEECTVSIRVTAERIAAGLVMLPIGEGLVFCPKGRGPLGLLCIIQESTMSMSQFGQASNQCRYTCRAQQGLFFSQQDRRYFCAERNYYQSSF